MIGICSSMWSYRFLSLLLLVAEFSLPGQSSASTPPIASDTADWCGTHQVWQSRQAQSHTTESAGCLQEGPCDGPYLRDVWIPEAERPFTVIRLYFHVLCHDNGATCASTEQVVADQVSNLNDDFAPSRIRFEYQMRFVNSTQFRILAPSEVNVMKNQLALAPDSQLNIWVTQAEAGFSFGTFPWDPAALSDTGGILMHEASFWTVQSRLAHEVGHCLGLYHTHHGVEEVPLCSPCYERAGALDRNLTGDFCSDTDPTPMSFDCSAPTEPDACTNSSWGPTDPWNIMGYSGETCWTGFSSEQCGRMHCYINRVLQTWSSGVKITRSVSLGPAPLTVAFGGETSRPVISWLWTFGDGDSALIQSPSHIFQPGQYAVTVTARTAEEIFETKEPDAVWAYADTVLGTDVQATPLAKLRVDITARNYLPLRELLIPLQWAGPLGLLLDSVSTADLRTHYFETQRFLDFNAAEKRALYQLQTSEQYAAPDLEAGNGPVLSLWFSVPASIQSGVQVIDLDGYGATLPTFITLAGAYNPIGLNVAITGCVPGDADGDFSGPDLSDLMAVVDYLFITAQLPQHQSAADTDGSGNIDLTDLQIFIDYLFFNGPAPQRC